MRTFRRHRTFGRHPGVPDDVLNPRATWSDKAAYDAQARDLCARFHKNFEVFNDYVDQSVRDAGPNLTA